MPTTEIQPADVYEIVAKCYDLLRIVAVLLGLAVLTFTVKSVIQWRRDRRVAELMVQTEDLAALSRSLMMVTRDKAEKQDDLAAKVKTDLDDRSAKSDAKLDTIHTLVNSAHGDTLKLHAVAARRLAHLTRDRADTIAAELAEHLLHEHDLRQAEADAVARLEATRAAGPR